MKQYAARGIVDRFGSTWVMRKSRSPPCAPRHSGKREDAKGGEDTGVGRADSATVFATAGDKEESEDMGQLLFCEAGSGKCKATGQERTTRAGVLRERRTE
jgi:hypothetical protein